MNKRERNNETNEGGEEYDSNNSNDNNKNDECLVWQWRPIMIMPSASHTWNVTPGTTTNFNFSLFGYLFQWNELAYSFRCCYFCRVPPTPTVISPPFRRVQLTLQRNNNARSILPHFPSPSPSWFQKWFQKWFPFIPAGMKVTNMKLFSFPSTLIWIFHSYCARVSSNWIIIIIIIFLWRPNGVDFFVAVVLNEKKTHVPLPSKRMLHYWRWFEFDSFWRRRGMAFTFPLRPE